MPSLIITGETVSVRLESEHLELVKRDPDDQRGERMIRMRVPLFDVDRCVIIGRPAMSIPVLQQLMKRGIPTFFLSSRYRWYGALHPDKNMNAERRIRQYQLANDHELALKISKKLVYAKLRNCRRVLQRLSANRSESENPAQVKFAAQIKNYGRMALIGKSLEEIRGYEGMGTAIYFSRLSDFFPPNVPFKGRNRQPPRDAANAILSWTYTIVLGELESVIRSHGLDPCIGFLHSVSNGSPSLALDLLEPLRPALCDMLVMHLLNHKVLTDDDFEFNAEDGGTYLAKDSMKEFFMSYEIYMTRKFTLRRGEDHIDYRKIIDSLVIGILKAMEGKEFQFFIMQ
ncbi:MAG TPA: CRISPR-associated endonuclease Cas1 [Lentisphaeria bacterium]|nr:MAG: CRISPR-associated endonuclease Cas1 [Lentisphaerae bacterium GWF2_38_69]HBM15074.1 CRISPR-associated endonuclease Cas1 [Lentisphaeria bacterium]